MNREASVSGALRLIAAAGALAGLAIVPASAQLALNATVIDIVRDWTASTELPEPVMAFGEACLLPELTALPEETKQIIIDAGNLDDGVDEADLYDLVQACIETMLVGEQIWAWLGDEGEADADRAACLMEAVRPLPTEGKLTIYQAIDFGVGTRHLIEDRPELAEGLEAALEACNPTAEPAP